MKQCVDSGLWVPSAESARLFGSDFKDEDLERLEEEEEEGMWVYLFGLIVSIIRVCICR